MPNRSVPEAVAKELWRAGVPGCHIVRTKSELEEHWADLKAEGLGEGLAEKEAEEEATRLLGRPAEISHQILCSLQQRSWWGRHPLVSLCLFPLVCAPLLMALMILPFVLLQGMGALKDMEAEMIERALTTLHYISMIAAPLLLCWGVRRAGLGRQWIAAMVLWSLLTGMLRYLDMDSTARQVIFTVTYPFHLRFEIWIVMVVHALVAAIFLRVPGSFSREAS
jgi:hypothetical protein